MSNTDTDINADSLAPPATGERNATVAVFDRHDAAGAAVRALKDGGVDPAKLAVIGRGVHSEDRVVGFYNTGKQIKHWGAYGALWGGLWGWLLVGLFWIPGIGHVTAAGWIIANLATAASGAAVGAGIGAIAAALSGVGVPDDAIPQYESALKADQYLVVVHGTADDVETAKAILDTTDATHVDVHLNTNV
jgi:uncharacterized membrane protein